MIRHWGNNSHQIRSSTLRSSISGGSEKELTLEEGGLSVPGNIKCTKGRGLGLSGGDRDDSSTPATTSEKGLRGVLTEFKQTSLQHSSSIVAEFLGRMVSDSFPA